MDNISKEKRNRFVAEKFISGLIKTYDKHPVSTEMEAHGIHKLKFLKTDHHIHSSFEKSIVERTMQYIKDRTESFDDYFPCRRKRSVN